MIFNSLLFVPFLALGCAVARLGASWRLRKLLLLLLSYAFYAAWYPWTIVLLWASTIVDWLVTGSMVDGASERRKRGLVAISVCFNLGMLGFFKYGRFVCENLNALGAAVGQSWQLSVPVTVLPVGISFYTFMSLAYVIDVYRGHSKPAKSFLDFALFLTFFPHLVAGPIVQSRDFLPQLEHERRADWTDMSWGLVLLVFGLFQKVVLADAVLAPVADRVFGNPAHLGVLDAWSGTLAFSCQIFCDFAGYSTCAVGAAACLGFRLPENFRRPYGAFGFSDFWRRWHITLSSWLRDYLYISLGGNRRGRVRTLLNLMVTMLLGGLWHGAAWTFVIWGALHGAFLCIERWLREAHARWRLPGALSSPWLVVPATFGCVTLAWVFFRAASVADALAILKGAAGANHGAARLLHPVQALLAWVVAGGILLFHLCFRDEGWRQLLDRFPRPALAVLVALLVFAIVTMAGEDRAFIYFQF